MKLDENRNTLFFNKGESVFKQGLKPAGLFALSSGKVKNIHLNESGGTHLINLNKPVDFLGFSDFISDQLHSYSCIAIENCSVCFIPAEDLYGVLKSNPALSFKSLQYISNEFRAYRTRKSNLLGKNMRGRMADTLLYIYHFFNVQKQADFLDLDLTREDYGSLAQMNTANSIRTLSEFSKRRLIRFEGHVLYYLNVKGLQQISLTE
ncbi:MAG: Crp/Fnr family transcriptional regulator [Saprospiraceae bacterium]|nr:Crp/Fnr family transcriptional regulator [Saprospiraceae bacterium]